MGFRKLIRKKVINKYGWFGDYLNWGEAKKHSIGYDAKNILEKTIYSINKIRSGEAVYERDSVLFERKEFPFAIISSLLYTAVKNGNHLNVLDFGGSLGSTWFQIRDFIPPQITISWSVVEQESYVTEGKKNFQDDVLSFYYTIEECIDVKKDIHIVILSGVIQYLEHPHQFLSELTQYPIDYILFDRTAFIDSKGKDRLTIQKVPPEIYDAIYPAWFFDEESFLKHFSSFNVKAEFLPSVLEEQRTAIDGKFIAYDKGFFLEKIRLH